MEPEDSVPCSRELAISPIMRQLNPADDLTTYFSNIHFNITLSSTPRTPTILFPLDFPYKFCMNFPPPRVTCQPLYPPFISPPS
jgi:hypothetical protein